ncbi:hypothetical protein [Elizabethkingia anophelis]|uniref:hypothetical protein n=1 Tax=Elizabethkingia anophelis TaxID=1117645 RepID=UPI0038918A07
MIEDILKEAINKINERHYSVKNPEIRLVNEDNYSLNYSKQETMPENNFVSRLISHYQEVINLRHPGLSEDVSPEMYPQIQLYKIRVRKQENEALSQDFDIKDGIYPDIVFHKDQYFNIPQNQKLVIECKINNRLSYEDFGQDLAKLVIYISEINFQKSIFLIANNEKAAIESYLQRFKNTYEMLNMMNVHIWVKNYGEEIEIIDCE